MCGGLGVLNAFSTPNYFQFMLGLLECNPIISRGRSVWQVEKKFKYFKKNHPKLNTQRQLHLTFGHVSFYSAFALSVVFLDIFFT